MTLNAVLRLTMENGGGTFDHNLELVTPNSGFAVGLVRNSYAILPLEDLEDFNHAILACLGSFPAAYIGTWVHNGSIYIDPVVVIPEKALALEFARQNKQLSIYNFSTGETINV